MRIFNFITQRYKQKKILINTLCNEQIIHIKTALTEYRNIFTATGFIELSIVEAYHNKWQELFSYTNNPENTKKMKPAKGYREYLRIKAEFKKAVYNIDAEIRDYNLKLSN
jgi:hypothetical protein